MTFFPRMLAGFWLLIITFLSVGILAGSFLFAAQMFDKLFRFWGWL